MELKSDTNGLFIEGMSDSSELADYIRRKFNEEDIQNTYESLTKGHIRLPGLKGSLHYVNFGKHLITPTKIPPPSNVKKVARIAVIQVWQQHKLNGMAY
jgi:hypothetical protein